MKIFKRDRPESIQKRPDPDSSVAPHRHGGLGFVRLLSDRDTIPIYWSRARDVWLRDFVEQDGNDLLSGTLSTVTAKIATTGWMLQGPRKTAQMYRRILLQQSEFADGWSQFIQKVARDYFTQETGAYIERVRMGPSGSALGFNHLDSGRMYLTGNPEYPVKYQPTDSSLYNKDELDADGRIKLHRSQVIRLVDSPSSREELFGIGHCAVSRAITFAQVLADITQYERERLSDLPPAGILFLNNLTHTQWDDLVESYDTRQEKQGNEIWRDILVAFGMDPALPIQSDFLTFSELPEHFNKRETIEITLYAFALAFRIDPREIYPVSAGLLGSAATEAAITHMKARTKGTGLFLTDLERAFNDGLSIPSSLKFRFDFQDSEEAAEEAERRWRDARFIGELYKMGNAEIEPIISRNEARLWLIKHGHFTEEDLGASLDEARYEDVMSTKTYVDLGPRVILHRDGTETRVQRRRWFPATPITPDLVAKAIKEMSNA